MPAQKIIKLESHLDRPERWEFKELEIVIMRHMKQRGPGWVTSREVACELGYPWRVIARAMIKMVEIEKQPMTWTSNRCRERKCLSYRVFHGPQADYPEWLIPKSHPVTAIGRVHQIEK